MVDLPTLRSVFRDLFCVRMILDYHYFSESFFGRLPKGRASKKKPRLTLSINPPPLQSAFGEFFVTFLSLRYPFIYKIY